MQLPVFHDDYYPCLSQFKVSFSSIHSPKSPILWLISLQEGGWKELVGEADIPYLVRRDPVLDPGDLGPTTPLLLHSFNFLFLSIGKIICCTFITVWFCITPLLSERFQTDR
jgi:hypothetical protein